MRWWKRLDIARLPVVRAGKHAGQAAHKVAVQGMERAKLTGAKLARHIIAVQQAAGANPKMMRESARSVMNRPMTLGSDRAWQASYVGEAGKHVPGLVPEPKPAPDTYRGLFGLGREYTRVHPQISVKDLRTGATRPGMTWSPPGREAEGREAG